MRQVSCKHVFTENIKWELSATQNVILLVFEVWWIVLAASDI